jgi:Second Messenger Oligonucleotide or Dinucleotide Synthetase domain
MLSVHEAFEKFKSKISEPTKKEREDASRRQQRIRELMESSFSLKNHFLSGSYARHTKTKPLKDVDIFCVLGEEEKHYRKEHPSVLLEAVAKVMRKEYGTENVQTQRRSVGIDFHSTQDETVMSFDVVPAFDCDQHYEVPDTKSKDQWIKTDPEIHKEKATQKHAAYSNEWKGLVRMVKTWNRHNDRPVKPSFLLEIMALELFDSDFGGDYRYELKGFFESAATHIFKDWPDPAGLGPLVSDGMEYSAKVSAQKTLQNASELARQAILLEKQGKVGEALRQWQSIFGQQFSMS